MPKHPLLLQSQHYTKTIAFILSSSKVILLYSHYAKKGLVYIAIAAPSSRQPFFYSKCTSINIQLSCNVRSVSDTKCTFHVYLYPAHSASGNT